MTQNQSNTSLKRVIIYKYIVSIILGLISFIGISFSSRFNFNGFSINFAWSIILPLLVTLAWGMKYGIISTTLGLVILYPFILGSYNGWASFVPAISLFLWITIHGYGSKKRLQKHRFYYNIYFLQLIHSLLRVALYSTLFPLLIRMNPPFWNPGAYTRINIGIVMLFAIKGVIVESIFLALCDALLLLPFIRKLFMLKYSRGARFNTRIMSALVFFGLSFTLIILAVHNVIIDKTHPILWLTVPSEKTRITFLLATILFFIMGGITVRFVQRVLETQEELKIREKQLENAVEEIQTLNRELEQRVRDRTMELQSAVCELEGFAYTISHDIKSPLRAIEGYSDLIMEDHGNSLHAEAAEMIGSIHGICRNMIGLTDRLLEYSLTSKASLSMERVDSRKIIEGVFHEFEICNPERSMKLFFEREIPEISADKVLFRQVIANIISNSVKFSRDREVTRITAGCTEEENEYVFYFRDNGVGFDMKYSNKLFGIFQRLHRSRDFEGTGIGLATVKKIIQKHGGRVWIEGILNEGTTLYFTVPLIKS